MEEIWLSKISCINLRISFREILLGPNGDQVLVNMFSCQKKKPVSLKIYTLIIFYFLKKNYPVSFKMYALIIFYFLIAENDVLGP